MTRGSDNEFPKVIMEEVANDGSATVTPAADHRALFLGEDGLLHVKDSGGTVTSPYTGSSLTIEEVDGSPSVAATELIFPNGTLGVVGTVATYTPAASGSGALTLLDQEVLGSAAADITITGISGSHKDLVVVISTKSAISGDGDWLYMQVGNGSIDTGSNYRYIRFFAGGSGTGTTVSTGDSKAVIGSQPGGNSTAGMFGHAVLEFPEYSTTTGSRKRGWVFNTSATGGAEFLTQFGGGTWNSTSAIDQIKVYAPSNNLITGSTVTVYGRS